ncbi:MAG TPA: DUF1801 domain-containing protein [Dehalococcoidia bacterium]|nr:DUF1801 domain-containing protein [Dehalococcoidia bacterium]
MSAREISAYIAAAPKDARPILRELRAIVRAEVPAAEEVISYQMPTFRHHGMLVSFAAFKAHVGLFALSSTFLNAFQDEVAPYQSGKGTLRLPYGQAVPVALIRKLVRARAQANERAAATRPTRRR